MYWRRQWHPTPVLLPEKSHGWRSLVGCSPWGRYKSDTTERLHFHFSLSCIGEGNGTPLQCSCLENPRNGEAWWAAVYGVTQSRTQLKRLSSIEGEEYWRRIEYLWENLPEVQLIKLFICISWLWLPGLLLWNLYSSVSLKGHKDTGQVYQTQLCRAF